MAFTISLTGKVALVAGGSRGIGAECCRQLALAGADIVINHTHSERGERAGSQLEQELLGMGVRVLRCPADISSELEVKEMVRQALSVFGHIDILVNCAAVMGYTKFEELSYAEWRQVMSINFDGPMLVTREVLPGMLARGGGSIIMISSNAVINGGGNTVHYPASKAGMEGIVTGLAKEYASRGIRANIVRPAVIDTELLRERYPTDEDMEKYARSMPVRRVGKPVDIANAVVFLASDKASYICGESLNVDGGRTYYK
jgi:3-oxoacyl-[acyl-carrier protein] reductase